MISNKLKKIGLNIIASTEIINLPKEILDILQEQNIPFTSDDTLCIVANGGKELWNHLPHPLDESINPIDQFSIQQMKILDPDMRIIFPHNEWNIPLQRIGRFLNISRPSLLGIDINQDYGLWFAFRGAFLTKNNLINKNHNTFVSACETCIDKPCVSSCPASAIIPEKNSFKLNICADYRLKPISSCADRCLARLACPYHNEHQYNLLQIKYHMTRKIHLHKLSDYKTKK